jgi:hypothetical protein
MVTIVAAGGTGETAALLVIGVLGILFGSAVYLVPGIFDSATRMRLRMQGLPDDDERTLERDRVRRRFIGLVLGVGSVVILVQGLARL